MPSTQLTDRYALRVRVLKALAHPTRLFLVEELAERERCVCELTERIGDDISTVSKHLALLRDAGVLSSERRGQQIFYRLRVPCVLEIFGCVEGVLSGEETGSELVPRRELTLLGATGAVFAVFYWLPIGVARFDTAILEALYLAKWYAREHVLLCLVPAFFIAGGIAVFLNQAAVMRYLGPAANRAVAYGVAAVSGSILAVCSCTVLPLFAGIHRRGAGLGPATAFLYSGPAINVLAIILTARVLGWQLGLARAIGAVLFSIVVGLAMNAIFRESPKTQEGLNSGASVDDSRPTWRTVSWLVAMVGILVFANWGRPQTDHGTWAAIYENRWWVVGVFGVVLLATLSKGFSREELGDWVGETWGFAKQILPLLLFGVLVAGLLLGRPDGGQGLIPTSWVERSVGGEGFLPTLFASVAGAFMYFATLTEIPILDGLLRSGMGNGPALALLLAGPALSLPNMLVIRSVMGTRRTLTYVVLVVVLSTVAGLIYGNLIMIGG